MRSTETTLRAPAVLRGDSPPQRPAAASAEASGAPARSRTLALLCVLAFAAAGCDSPPREVGRPPEGELRRDETLDERIARERRERAAERGTSVPDPGTDPERIGVRATHKFHRRGCAELAKTAADGQETFRSSWDAINNDYAPCTVCKAGPQPEDSR